MMAMTYVKKDNKLYYVVDYWDHIQKAFDGGFYVEALQIPHSYINGQMQMLLQLEGQRTRPDEVASQDYNQKIDTANELGYAQLAKALYVTGVFTHDLYLRLMEFNKIRNKIIHKLFSENSEETDKDNGIPLVQIDKAVKDGIKLCDEVRMRGEDIIEEFQYPSTSPSEN